MSVSVTFSDADSWTCRYQRNNKRSGLKNLRCFPMCSDQHRLRGFCGRPAHVTISNPGGLPIQTFAEFVKLSDNNINKSPSSSETAKPPEAQLSITDIEARCRGKDDLFLPWIAGIADDAALPATSQATVQSIYFNKNRRGWHYGWMANKHTCDSTHALRVYVYVDVGHGNFRFLSHSDSPAFTIFCRRRQRHNLDRLPAQLKAQLDLQDSIKSTGGSMSQLPKSIPIEAQDELLAQQDGDNAIGLPKGRTAKRKETMAHKNSSPKRARAQQRSDQMAEHMAQRGSEVALPAEEQIASPRLGVKIKPTTYDEKGILLFYVIRSIMRLNVKSSTSLLDTLGPKDIQVIGAAGELGKNFERSSDSDGVEEERKESDSGEFKLGGNTVPGDDAFEDISKSISECLDCFAPGANGDTDQESFGASQYDPSDVFSEVKSTAGFDIPNLSDFEPFDLDFSVLEAELSGSNLNPPPNLEFSDLMREYATFLIEEREFTEAMERALTSSGTSSPLQSKNIAVAVLLDLLRTFLLPYNISLDELYYLFKTQVWEKQAQPRRSDAKDASDKDAAYTLVSLEQREKARKGAEPTEVSPEAKKRVETRLLEHVAHYTETVRKTSFSGVVGDSVTHPSSPCLDKLGPEAKFSVKSAPALGCAVVPASLPVPIKNEIGVSPPRDYKLDPRYDFTGTWERSPETLDILEGVRELMGVPWVLRKMMRYIESVFTVTQPPGLVETQCNRKLLCSGYQCYEVDGKEHTWNAPPPIPTERTNRSATYQASFQNGVFRLVLAYSYRKRVIRETFKTADNSCLSSTFLFQYRESANHPWEDKLRARCAAYRREDAQTVLPPNTTSSEHEMVGELSWLSFPCDDFSLTLN